MSFKLWQIHPLSINVYVKFLGLYYQLDSVTVEIFVCLYYYISYEHCCWVSLESPVNRLGAKPGWKLMTLVNLNPRPDGRGINSSPVPALIPLEKFYKGCQYQLRIAGEVVRATLATPYTVPERTLDFGSDGGARTATWYYGSFGERFFLWKGGHSMRRP